MRGGLEGGDDDSFGSLVGVGVIQWQMHCWIGVAWIGGLYNGRQRLRLNSY